MKNNLFWLHVSVWVLVFVLSWVAFSRFMPWQMTAVRAVCNIGLMMVLFYGVSYLYTAFFKPGQYRSFALLAAALAVVTGVVRYKFNTHFDYQLPRNAYFVSEERALIIGIVITNLSTIMSAMLYESILHRNRADREKLVLLNEQKNARLQLLRSQMNPHFLLNTLNNIYSLAVVRSELTAPLVLRLSELLRYVVYDAQEESIELQTEVDILRLYFDLFALQLEHKPAIQLTSQLPEKVIMIEPLLLLPLAENCCKHADVKENPQGYINMDVSVQGDELLVSTRNSCSLEPAVKDGVGGVGLDNIRNRLQILYPNAHALTLNSEPTFFEVKLTLKLHE